MTGVAIIGTGMWAPRLAAAAERAGLELPACFSRDEARRAEDARRAEERRRNEDARAEEERREAEERHQRRRLFRHATLDTRPGDPAFDAELVDLHRRLLADRPDAAWVAAATTLWEDVAAESDAGVAWGAVVTVLLRDPAYVSD